MKVKNENVATLTSAPTPAVISNCGCPKARNAAAAPAPGASVDRAGISASSPPAPSRPNAAIARNTARHDHTLPR
ncbi:hypothetical protein LMG3481_05867 [Achromobacter deleyi]|nr:hypothetical protein LMG3412_05769 [Achromobacter deleyi]CAB3926195.1 hypothetical protein LMG3481_05867 [Achromobacter deleyi]